MVIEVGSSSIQDLNRIILFLLLFLFVFLFFPNPHLDSWVSLSQLVYAELLENKIKKKQLWMSLSSGDWMAVGLSVICWKVIM